MVYLYIAIALVVGYFLGSINFAIIFSINFWKKDITQEGSKNPGTMNMLRTQGFGRAMLTLAFEALKVGLPALGCYFLFRHFPQTYGFEHLAYFVSAFGGIVGHCYPVFYKFKGGKGVACTFGMFLFHPEFWWFALVMFALCFALFFFIQYGFIISFIFIFIMTIYATCMLAISQVMWWVPILVLLWLIVALVVFKHRGNISRLVHGTENKVNFKQQVFSKMKKKKENQEKVEKQNENNLALNVESAQENVEENKKETN